ncbi:MAG: amidohydrolase family protein [Pseudomonadales bacterium]|jgi:predicted TIM-barrel fold metal-dependent hydrolase|nr:amidohydrolase family protein [Pseudomonadales bacterium]
MWGNDYPHYEGTFPYNLESLRLTFADIPEDVRRRVLGCNAAEVYKFDIEKLMSLVNKFGPTPDQVMYDFPELVFVTRHGCEPWEDLAVELMLKWPNLYYSTTAFAPKFYPKAIIDYANSRGADKIIYGRFP